MVRPPSKPTSRYSRSTCRTQSSRSWRSRSHQALGIYHDTNYETILPGQFHYAALLFARVLDLPGENLVCLDLGHKRFAIDTGLPQLFSHEGLSVVTINEEHTVLELAPGLRLELGDGVLFVPDHICPTVNLWESFTLVEEDGRIEQHPIEARNR